MGRTYITCPVQLANKTPIQRQAGFCDASVAHMKLGPRGVAVGHAVICDGRLCDLKDGVQ